MRRREAIGTLNACAGQFPARSEPLAKAKSVELTNIHSADPMITISSPHWTRTTGDEGAGGLNFSGIVGSMITRIAVVACTSASYGKPSRRFVGLRRTLMSDSSHAKDYVMYNAIARRPHYIERSNRPQSGGPDLGRGYKETSSWNPYPGCA